MPIASTEAKYLRANKARVDKHARQLQAAVQRWLLGFAVKEAREASKELRAGRVGLRKAAAYTDEELLQILTAFGLRQIDSTGRQTAVALDGSWVIPPSLVTDTIRTKSVEVQRIVAETRESVRDSIRQLVLDAQTESPQPSVGELARRIRTQFHGDQAGKAGELRDVTEPEFGILPTAVQSTDEGVLYAFSSERAALIARTESAQNENTGIVEGMAMAGIEEIEWLPSGNPNRGDRRHDKMRGKRVKIGEYFTTPLGNKLRYPGDPQGPIKETAN
jgi:hypothetical protein